jgi:hypothetical protein
MGATPPSNVYNRRDLKESRVSKLKAFRCRRETQGAQGIQVPQGNLRKLKET